MSSANLDLFSWHPPAEPPVEAEPPPEPARKRRRRLDDESARGRRRTVATRQREKVLAVLREQHPHAVSHAAICEAVSTNRASHRIRELVHDGWAIEGAGTLGLDQGSQTQLYRLRTLERGEPRIKHLGLKVLWDQEGLKVGLHRDIDGDLPEEVLLALARRIEGMVREELTPLLEAWESEE